MTRDDYFLAELLALRKGLTDIRQQLWPFLSLQTSLDPHPSSVIPGLKGHTHTPPGFPAYSSTSPRKLPPGTAAFFLLGSLPEAPCALTVLAGVSPPPPALGTLL